jgi:ketosteroid isomerase-like protein
MTTMDPKDICKVALAAYVVGDHVALIELTHPDAVFRFPGDPAILPWAGTFAGSQMKRFFDAVKDNLDFLEFSILRIDVAGDHVYFEAHEHCRVRATGSCFRNDLLGLMSISGGKISSYREYSDTATLHAAISNTGDA